MVLPPLLVLCTALLGTAAGSPSSSPDTSDIVEGLANVCLGAAERTVAAEVRSGLQAVQRQVAALQQQLSAVQQQLPPTPPTDGGCPVNWSHQGSSCYLMPPGKVTWLEAERACAALDPRAHLVSIHPANKDAVSRLLAASGEQYVHIGLFRLTSSTSWGWTDGTPVDFTNWQPGEPTDSGGNEDCVTLNTEVNDKWNDYNCSGQIRFMCQIRLT